MPPVNYCCLVTISLATCFVVAQQPEQSALTVGSAAEVIEKWTPDQHLYVKGNLGVSVDQLQKLETWLDENGPHWTIVLMENADDETYRALDQRQFDKLDAVEHALGHGLANRTEFSQWLHPKTGESDGAVFVLFLVERKFSYYGSNAQDNRGIGDSHWIGDLDRDAIRAMRNGGRIIDAVKDTVTSINSRLTAKIQNEEQAEKQAAANAQRAAQERRRELSNLAAKLDEARNHAIPRIEESARQIRTAFPKATASKLAQPPLDRWKTQIDNLKTELSHIDTLVADPYQQSPEFLAITQRTNEIRGELDHFLDLYAAHKSFEAMVWPVEQRLDMVADHPNGAAIPASDEAYRLLVTARDLHARGDVSFAENIQVVSQLTDQAEQAVAQEERRLQDEVNRKQIIRRTLLIAAAILAALGVGLLWLLNLRRRPALGRAHVEFDRRSKSVEVEIASLQPALNRCGQVLGTSTEFVAKKFRGQTEQLGKNVLTNVAQLKLMSAEVEGVIADANRLLHPSNPLVELSNLFSSARYEHCVNLLNGESIRVPANIGESASDATNETPAWLTFEQLFQQLRQTEQTATVHLGQLENGFKNVDRQLESLQAKLASGSEVKEKLVASSRLDRYFPVPALAEKLLPAAESDFESAQEIADVDPVAAVRLRIPAGLQRIDNGMAIANSIQHARRKIFPQLDLASTELKKLGFDIRWIEKSVIGLGDRANHLLAEAVQRDVATSAEQFDTDVNRLGIRARRCVELANTISDQTAPRLDKLQAEIETARQKIASELALDKTLVLHENDYDPDGELAAARKQLQSARAAVDYGGVESIMESLEVVEIESATAREWIEQSLAALKGFATEHAERLKRQSTLAEQLPVTELLIQATSSKYADSALRIGNGSATLDQDCENDQEVLTEPTTNLFDCQSHARQLIDSVSSGCQQANELHFTGKVLESANVLQLLGGDLKSVEELLDGIQLHCHRLDTQSEANHTELGKRLNVLQALAESVTDSRTQSLTLQRFAELKSASEDLQLEIGLSATHRDPFLDQKRLAKLEFNAAELAVMLEADRSAHHEATHAVAAARREFETAQQSVFRSVNDKIPDSETIMECQTQVAKFEVEIKKLRERTNSSHDDWRDVATSSNRITSELAVIDGQLRRELDLAQQAAKKLQVAAQAIYEAASWSGRYGVTVIMNPGSKELDQARRLLSEGEYLASVRSSNAAKQAANSALASAKRTEKTRQRQIAEAAAARRASESLFNVGSSFSSGDSSSSTSSWSSNSGSSSWSSDSSSSSSSSPSSDSSSNSGFSRSGW